MSRKSYPNVNAANQYARDVVRGKIVACQFVIQACQRHLDDLMAEKSKSFRYRFDKDLAERAAKFIQLLPHTKGEWAFKRMPITLEPWQLFVICCAFGWVNKGTRLRRFREVYTEIPRKNGKSAISAGVALYCFACDNEFGAEVYSGATTEKQAWEVFRPARLMCKRTPMLTEAFGIEVNQAANTAQDSGASLLIGHASNGAEIVANSLVLMPSADYARQICGAGSQLARMVEAYRQTDPFGELYVIAVPEATGAAATVTLTVTGEATESGTVNVYVGRTRVQAPVTNGDNVTTIASSIQDAINAVPTLPFTASSLAGVVTLTARHKGLCGNEIPVSLNYYGFGGGEVLPAGVQIAVATGTAGTGAPVLTGAVAAMADEPFDYIG
ncbi:TPA: terminase large subunit, partial [Escherichia coli]